MACKPESYDSEKTEYQNMIEMGFDRVWDCGTLKYALKNNT